MTKIIIRICGLCFMLNALFIACATIPSREDIQQAEAHYKLGISLLNENNLKEAYVEFQKAIQLNHEDKHSLNYLGIISARFGEYDRAINYYKRAIAIDPNYSEAMNNMGIAYLETGDWDEAIQYFKMALNNPLYTTPDMAYSNLGYAYYKKGDYKNALNTLDEAAKKYTESPQSAYIAGLIYMKLGDTKTAIAKFNNAVTILPDYLDAHWELANAYLKEGNRRKAIEHFEIVAESGVDNEKTKEALKYIELLKE